jgi:hypothetical protein
MRQSERLGACQGRVWKFALIFLIKVQLGGGDEMKAAVTEMTLPIGVVTKGN